jgi:Asp-tRNA(Asn)/Glu-tRNA(Gln) amidotransferase B subunit
LNRIVTLRDSWQARDEAAPRGDDDNGAREKSAKAKTRPPKKSRAEYRAEARRRDPELAARFDAWPGQHGITGAEADLLTGDRPTGDLFAAAVATGAPAPAVARWIANELPPALGDRDLAATHLTAVAFGALVAAVESGAVTAGAAKEVLAELVERGGDPAAIVAERGLAQVDDDDAIGALVDEVLGTNPDKVAAYRDGKTALAGFFVGQVLKASGGKANPKSVQRLLGERLR